MTTLLRPLRRWFRARLQDDRGFTLVEIIIAVSLLGLITGAATASLITATSAARSSTEHVHQSSDAQLISAFLVKDAQAAGGTNPRTGREDPSLGVFYADASGCDPVAGLVIQFRWVEWVSKTESHKNAASYLLDPASPTRFSRRLCRDSVASGDLLLASSIASVTPSCNPALNCPGLPFEVMFHITETGPAATAFNYDLRAQLRSQAQNQPSSLNSGTVPLMALGGGACPPSGAFLNVNGSSDLVVQLGDAVINSGGGCDAMHISGNGIYAADSTSILSPGACSPNGGAICPPISSYADAFDDPLAGLNPPSGDCAAASGNPVPLGGIYQPGVYKNGLTVPPPDTFYFAPGNYVFCADVRIRGTVVAPNVLFYFASGTLTVDATASVTVGSQLSGDYQDVSIWLSTNQDVTINGGTGIDSYKGVLYAPLALVNISGGTNLQIGSVIARAINLTGGGRTTLGPGVTITTPQMGAAVVGSPFILPMVAQAGVGPYHNWTVTGLPGDFTMDSSGVIRGTPTSASLGSHRLTFSVTDSSTPINRTTSRTYDDPYWLTVGGGTLKITPAALLDATRYAFYSTQIVATGGVGIYTWSSTPLPAGLILNTSSGLISGTPTDPMGPYSFTVSVVDGTLVPVSQQFNLRINNPPVIDLPLFLPETTVGATYLALSSVRGGSAPITWSVASGPAWLGINPVTGSLGGTPTTAGNYNVIITATDRNLAAASKPPLPLKVNPAPSITTPTNLPGWAVGAAYPSTTMTATGGTGSYRWSAVGLPGSLSMSLGGVITGTPNTAVTNAPVAVTVTDSVGVSVTRPFSITITGALSITAPTNLPNWDAGSAYPTNVTATAGGGSGGYVWSSSTLPSGLAIDVSTGAITGTPTNPGPYADVVLRVTDSNGVVATRPYTMTVHQPLSFTGPGSLPNWVASTAYPSQTATVSGGSGSNTWTATGLPPGLSLSSGGVLSGTPSPSSPGAYNAITFSVADGTGGGFDVGPFSMTIFQPLGISTAGVPSAGVVGTAYNGSLSASGGSVNLSWSAAGLPAELTMSSAGVLTGTPQTNATYSVTFTVTDNGTGGSGGPHASISVPFTIKTYQPLRWGTLPTPPTAWTAGFVYPAQTFTTVNGAPSVTWAISGLPAGMSFSGGRISGTPTTAAPAATVTVTATDGIGPTLTKTFTLTINPAIALTASPAPPATITVVSGQAFTPITYSTSGGTGTVSLSSSVLPAGLAFNGTVLNGTPSNAGTTTITITATDTLNATTFSSFILKVQGRPTLLTLKNGGGNGNVAGTVEKGDSIEVTYSPTIDAASICGGTTPFANPVVTLKDGGATANDSITVVATGCGTNGLGFGTIDLGSSGFVTGGDISFGSNGTASTITLVGNKITITLGNAKSTPANGVTAGTVGSVTATYIPDAVITAGGLTLAGPLVNSPAVLF